MTDRVPVSYETPKEPLILIVPGNHADDAPHWQQAWERKRADCERLDLGMWDDPHRNTWVTKLNLAIDRIERPVVLVADGLATLAVAWWAEYERPAFGYPVIGALLIAPPDVDRPGLDARVAKFGAVPRRPLPFPAFLVPDRTDPLCNYRTAYGLARDWDARFVDPDESEPDAAPLQTDAWRFGERLVNRLLREYRLAPPPRPDAHGAHPPPGLTDSGVPAPVVI
jgi:predicted alpha/beta hydrolase family esterase